MGCSICAVPPPRTMRSPPHWIRSQSTCSISAADTGGSRSPTTLTWRGSAWTSPSIGRQDYVPQTCQVEREAAGNHGERRCKRRILADQRNARSAIIPERTLPNCCSGRGAAQANCDNPAAGVRSGDVGRVGAVVSGNGAGPTWWLRRRTSREVWLLQVLGLGTSASPSLTAGDWGWPAMAEAPGGQPAERPCTRYAPDWAISHGKSRGAADPSRRSPGEVCAGRTVYLAAACRDSQAQSTSSILVTRSSNQGPGQGYDPRTGPHCCLDHPWPGLVARLHHDRVLRLTS